MFHVKRGKYFHNIKGTFMNFAGSLVLGTLGKSGSIFLGAVLLLGFFAQIFLGVLCRKLRWVQWLPAAFGLLGLLMTAGMPLGSVKPVEPGVLLLYWLIYGSLLLLG